MNCNDSMINNSILKKRDLSGISQGIVILEDGAGSVSQMAMAPKEETE